MEITVVAILPLLDDGLVVDSLGTEGRQEPPHRNIKPVGECPGEVSHTKAGAGRKGLPSCEG